VALMAMRELEVKSPRGSGGWVDRASNWNRDRSRSPNRSEHDRACSPVRSFHQAMMEKSQSHRPGSHSEKTRESSQNPRPARSPSLVGRIAREGILGDRMVMLHRNGMEDMVLVPLFLPRGRGRHDSCF